MFWLLVIGGVILWLVYRGSKAPKVELGAARQRLLSGHGSSPLFETSGRVSPQVGRVSRRTSAPAHWVPVGQTVNVAGVTIPSGMFYLGGSLPGQFEGDCGNCVVDPACKVASSGEDRLGNSMSYWPSYQRMTPVARRTYLGWLAGGRDDPSIGIGYVFLFFYGIERRLLVDGAQSEAPDLVHEVRRLLEIYGTNNSFKGYATRFLDAARLFSSADMERPQLSPDLRSGYEMPMQVRVYLGRKLAARESLDHGEALLWLLSLPDTNLRTPARRCFTKLLALWRHRFAERYPNGLKVRPPKSRLKLDYRAASGGFTYQTEICDGSGPLPDIAAISAPLDSLRDILNACSDELAAYSRLLGRSPEARGTMEAALLLPMELFSSTLGEAVVQRLEQLFAGRDVVSLKVSELADALSLEIEANGNLPAGLCNKIGALLDRLDIAFEPDRRYGSRNMQGDGCVLLFKARNGASVDGDAPDFVAARTMIDISSLAVAADGRVEPEEFESIVGEVRALSSIGEIEKVRLTAYASTFLKDMPAQQAAIQKLKALSPAARQATVDSATAAVLADGHASPAEVKFLERLYKTLGFPKENLYAALHRGAIALDEPVPVSGEHRTPGVPIPGDPRDLPTASTGVQIDLARLERLRSETLAVSRLLAGIFVEDELAPPPPPAETSTPTAAPRFSGLDTAHSALLEYLLSAPGLARERFDDLARDLRLLPDGAIELINDWGFDLFGEPIIDDDLELSIAHHIEIELKGMEATT